MLFTVFSNIIHLYFAHLAVFKQYATELGRYLKVWSFGFAKQGRDKVYIRPGVFRQWEKTTFGIKYDTGKSGINASFVAVSSHSRCS